MDVFNRTHFGLIPEFEEAPNKMGVSSLDNVRADFDRDIKNISDIIVNISEWAGAEFDKRKLSRENYDVLYGHLKHLQLRCTSKVKFWQQAHFYRRRLSGR